MVQSELTPTQEQSLENQPRRRRRSLYSHRFNCPVEACGAQNITAVHLSQEHGVKTSDYLDFRPNYIRCKVAECATPKLNTSDRTEGFNHLYFAHSELFREEERPQQQQGELGQQPEQPRGRRTIQYIYFDCPACGKESVTARHLGSEHGLQPARLIRFFEGYALCYVQECINSRIPVESFDERGAAYIHLFEAHPELFQNVTVEPEEQEAPDPIPSSEQPAPEPQGPLRTFDQGFELLRDLLRSDLEQALLRLEATDEEIVHLRRELELRDEQITDRNSIISRNTVRIRQLEEELVRRNNVIIQLFAQWRAGQDLTSTYEEYRRPA